jgi:hypothetical protein
MRIFYLSFRDDREAGEPGIQTTTLQHIVLDSGSRATTRSAGMTAVFSARAARSG